MITIHTAVLYQNGSRHKINFHLRVRDTRYIPEVHLLKSGKVELVVDVEQHIRGLSCADVGIPPQVIRLNHLALSFFCLRLARRGGL